MKQILLIEDDWPVATALAARLTSAGYEVLTAPGPSVGTAFAKARHPDLIITDIFMPSTDGLTLVRQLRDQGFGQVPFMVITASQREGLWEQAMRLGAAAYFEKPYDPQRLLQAVATTFHRSNSQLPNKIV
jgi:CheY-like chemotaxis protein